MVSKTMDKSLRRLLAESKLLIGIFLLLSQLSCSGGGKESFKFAGDDSQSSEITSDVEIIDYTPKDNPVIVTHSGVLTFAVTVGSGAGNNLSYTFTLDNTVVQSGSNGFFDLNQANVGSGDHVLDVFVTNGITNDSRVFYLTKNTPPSIDSTNPAASGNTVGCGGGAIVFTVEASDVNGEALDFVWKYNSAVFPAAFSSIVSTETQSSATFAPPCTLSGAGTISVEVSDGYDVASYTWSVSVTNPIVAQITSFTPATSPVIIPSVGSQLFSISPQAKSPFTQTWLLDGTPIGGATDSHYTLTAGSVTTGPHTLKVIVEDSDSSAEHTFNIVKNAPPSLTNPDPSTVDLKMNYLSSKTFSIEATDANGDNLTYQWTVDGNISGYLLDSPTPNGSQAILSGNAALVGTHIIRVRVDDGTEYTDYQWTVDVNYFSDACNNLQSSQICTVVGRVGLGSGQYPGSTPEVVNIHPTQVESDGTNGVFIADQANHLVWYHNLSSSAVTRLGKTIEPGQIVALVGNGAPGDTPNNSKNNGYKLNRPEGLAWDPVTESLFIAQYNANIISRVDSTGSGLRVACDGTTGVATTGPALSHKCYQPTGLALDPVARKLYVSNYHNNTQASGHIRVFDISDANPANWTGEIFVSGGAPVDGTIAGTARSQAVWAMDLDSRGVLYWVDGRTNCQFRVANTTGSSIKFFEGGASEVTVAAGAVKTLTGGSCANGEGDLASTSFNALPRGMTVLEPSPGDILGWFVVNYEADRIVFLNNTGSAITFGDGTAAAYSSARVVGTSSASGDTNPNYNGNLKGNLTRVNQPYGVDYFAPMNSIVFGDYINSRFRALDLSVSAGFVSTLAGEDFKYGNSGDGGKAPDQIIMREPRDLAADHNNKILYINDSYNGRIRMVDLVTGWVTTAMGVGRNNTNAAANPVDFLGLYFGDGGSGLSLGGARGLYVHPNGNLLFGDRDDSAGANSSCVIRMANFQSTAFNFLGITIPINRVAAVAGDWTLGCGAHTNGNQATNSALHFPHGVAYDGTNMYISAWGQHCILKVAADGTLSTLVGLCGTAGYQDGELDDTDVRLRNPATIAMDPAHESDGNFYFVDADNNQANTYLRYVNQKNTPVVVSGITIPERSVGTIVTAGASHRLKGVAAFGNQFCFAKGEGTNGPHNVTCRDRDDDLQNTTLRVGSSDNSPVAGGAPLGDEQEGIPASNATLYEPLGLAFDHDGNLYITERQNHQVRKVKRWFP